jgi:predicted DCC family thiol-disulfide oxidoreductase YuxK
VSECPDPQVHLNIHVKGSVISSHDMQRIVQEASRDAWARMVKQIPWRKRFVAWLRRFPRP